MSSDPRTREYVARHTAAGRTKKEIIRLLKRAIAREVFRCLTTRITLPHIGDLRPLRQAKNITLIAAAQHFGIWPTAISRLERGLSRNDDLSHAYRDWLHALDSNSGDVVPAGDVGQALVVPQYGQDDHGGHSRWQCPPPRPYRFETAAQQVGDELIGLLADVVPERAPAPGDHSPDPGAGLHCIGVEHAVTCTVAGAAAATITDGFRP